MYLVDTSVWVEYFRGSKVGEIFHHMLQKEKEEYFVTESVMSEINSWCLKEKFSFSNYERIIVSNAKILAINYEDWVSAAVIKHKLRKNNKKFRIMDALIVAKQNNHTLLTKDSDFKGLPKVKILEYNLTNHE